MFFCVVLLFSFYILQANSLNLLHDFLNVSYPDVKKEIFLQLYYRNWGFYWCPYKHIWYLRHDRNLFWNWTMTDMIYPGWDENFRSPSHQTLANAFNGYTRRNIIFWDYNNLLYNEFHLAQYVESVVYMQYIGNATGEILKYWTNHVQPANYLHLIGYGLGCHIMSYAAKYYGRGRLWLTALDPTSLLIQFGDTKRHLRRKDGSFVEVIHTDFKYGFIMPLGHVDVYINENRINEPACDLVKELQLCSHRRAWQYYAQMLDGTETYTAVKCRMNYIKCSFRLLNPYCDCNQDDYFQLSLHPDTTKRGKYFLRASKPTSTGPSVPIDNVAEITSPHPSFWDIFWPFVP